MFFLKKKEIKEAFSNVSSEMASMHEWLFYFYHYNQNLLNFLHEQDDKIKKQHIEMSELKQIVKNLPNTREEIKDFVDSYYSFDSIMDRLKAIENRMDSLEKRKIVNEVQKVSAAQQSSNIRDKVLRKIARSSKEYIKNLVLNLVGKYGKISALQLREIIVEEQGLCSKSSFYRILEELEREDSLNVVSRGKIKVYLDTTQKTPNLTNRN